MGIFIQTGRQTDVKGRAALRFWVSGMNAVPETISAGREIG
ncbi:hypothetical protein AtDm6_2877 [Acetobacter tropicalis]|uniref:Uncharacterized protein n=1 Tax=Acetobacter tropicalis TaxID=104102 RepID=A0A094ZFB0_9PROT|nr:hypothetical protein AtDm6_2877 [Acetobacter tropicalis]